MFKTLSYKKKKLLVLIFCLVAASFTFYRLGARIIFDVMGNLEMTRHTENGTLIFTQDIRPDRCQDCFIIKHDIIMGNKNMCHFSKDEDIKLIIMISTTGGAIERRMALRTTWLNYAKNNTSNVRYAFVLGAIKNQTLLKQVQSENEYYQDIIQGNFIDNYYTLTIKTLTSLKWAVDVCPDDTIIMKTDDDIYINIPGLLNAIKSNREQLQTSVGGFCLQVADPVRSHQSKYFVSYYEFPREKYPGYCSGTGYITSVNVAKQIVNISKDVPFFHLEDVYVSLCIEQISLSLYDIQGFNTVEEGQDLCFFKSNNVVTLHNVFKPPAFMTLIWNTYCD